jgi:tetratricopeptide (TPR) repeat protein
MNLPYLPSISRMLRLRHGVLLPVLLIQAACVGVGKQQRPVFEPFPEEPRAPVSKSRERPQSPAQGRASPEPSSPEDRTAGSGVPVVAPPAVIALQGEAEASLQSGDYDNAAATLERAIRIQPRNPALWHDLAEVRLKQQQPGLAEDLAKKSNLHAKGNAALIRSNWAVIAEARRMKGDSEGAADAQEKAGE